MTNFEKIVDLSVAEYLKDKDVDKLYVVRDLYTWSINFIKHLTEIRTKETCVQAVMDSIQRNTGSYWQDWVRPSFVDIRK